MESRIELEIAGLGFVLYSPFAVSAIPPGSDYLTSHFWNPTDVARQVAGCQITGFCTGTPGRFSLLLSTTPITSRDLANAEFSLVIGLEVRDRTVCIRDLYDLARWDPQCPPEQTFEFADGFYEVTVVSSCPPSGILGDKQELALSFRLVPQKPALRFSGVPVLCS